MAKRSDTRVKNSGIKPAPIPKRETTAADVNDELRMMLDLVKRGEPLEKHFTVRTLRLNIDVKQYTGADIQAIRKKLNASRALLAVFLGVSERVVVQWEQGERKPPLIVRRYLDDINEFPELWKKRLKSVKTVRVE